MFVSARDHKELLFEPVEDSWSVCRALTRKPDPDCWDAGVLFCCHGLLWKLTPAIDTQKLSGGHNTIVYRMSAAHIAAESVPSRRWEMYEAGVDRDVAKETESKFQESCFSFSGGR